MNNEEIRGIGDCEALKTSNKCFENEENVSECPEIKISEKLRIYHLVTLKTVLEFVLYKSFR